MDLFSWHGVDHRILMYTCNIYTLFEHLYLLFWALLVLLEFVLELMTLFMRCKWWECYKNAWEVAMAHRCTIHKVWWVEYRYKSTVDGHIMWVTMVCGYDDISNNKKTYRNTLINLTMCMDFVRLCYLMLIVCISCVNLIVNLLLEVQGKEICVLVLYCKMGMLWKSLHSTWLHWSKVVLHMWQYHWHKHVDMQQGWRSTWKIEDEVLNSLYCKHFYFELNLTTMQMGLWM